jgi:hypothetical protein
MELRVIRAIIMAAAGRTATPTALPKIVLPSMILPLPVYRNGQGQ